MSPTQVPRRSTPTQQTSSVPGNKQTLESLEKNKRLQARATAENGTDGDGNALLSETSTSSTIASPSTQPSPPIHGEEHESTNIANTDDSEDVIDLSQPAPIRKYESFEDESFYEEVHLEPFNK